jgi:superfamily II DNA or RNA helicase
MVIVDEAQHVAASKVLEVLGSARAHYVYAMTATPKRDDGLDRILFLECGPLRHEVAVADQIEEQGIRRVLVPRISAARPDLGVRPTWHQVVDYISASEERNHLVAI